MTCYDVTALALPAFYRHPAGSSTPPCTSNAWTAATIFRLPPSWCLRSSPPDAQQGISVALSADGNTAIVGGPLDNSSAGAAWAFVAPTPAATHDFNADCRSDILWRNATTGQVLGWFLNGSTVIGGGSPGSATNDTSSGTTPTPGRRSWCG